MDNQDTQAPQIHAATASDIPGITSIYAHAVETGKASFELEPPSEREMLRRFQVQSKAGYPYIVARIDNKVAGYAYVSAYRDRPGYNWTVEDAIYVNQNFQKRGIGSLLLNRLIELSIQQNYRQMIAVIGDSANTGSILVHQRAGFTPVGTFASIGRKHGVWLDVVLMQKTLGDGDTTPPTSK